MIDVEHQILGNIILLGTIVTSLLLKIAVFFPNISGISFETGAFFCSKCCLNPGFSKYILVTEILSAPLTAVKYHCQIELTHAHLLNKITQNMSEKRQQETPEN